MSSNDQVIVAPLPDDLDRWGVWHDLCVDNPFDYRTQPCETFDDISDAVNFASKILDEDLYVEYGMRIVRREDVTGYKLETWDEFPDYTYLCPTYDYASTKG